MYKTLLSALIAGTFWSGAATAQQEVSIAKWQENFQHSLESGERDIQEVIWGDARSLWVGLRVKDKKKSQVPMALSICALMKAEYPDQVKGMRVFIWEAKAMRRKKLNELGKANCS